jgi:hypothetical protein
LNNQLDERFRLYFLLSRELFLKAFPDNGSRCLHCWILDLTGKVRPGEIPIFSTLFSFPDQPSIIIIKTCIFMPTSQETSMKATWDK